MEKTRLTRLVTAIIGMVFFITSLLMGVWTEVSPLKLVERTLLGGVAGIVCGFVIGSIYSQALSEWLSKDDAPSLEEQEISEELPAERPELQPWNPPRIDKDEQGS